MIECIFEIRIDLDEDTRFKFEKEDALIFDEDLAQYGKEVWFRRDFALPFLPVIHMPFEFGLIDLPDSEDPHHRFTTFIVEQVGGSRRTARSTYFFFKIPAAIL